jgi:hypothetical protein
LVAIAVLVYWSDILTFLEKKWTKKERHLSMLSWRSYGEECLGHHTENDAKLQECTGETLQDVWMIEATATRGASVSERLSSDVYQV